VAISPFLILRIEATGALHDSSRSTVFELFTQKYKNPTVARIADHAGYL